MHPPNGLFDVEIVRPSSDWIHIVGNYIGPQDGQGIRIYYDGIETGSDTTKDGDSEQVGEGRIVIGRLATDEDADYASVEVDELMFFNMKLTEPEIVMLSQC